MSSSGEYYEYSRIAEQFYILSSGPGHDKISGKYHEYIGGCSVHQRDTMSTLGGLHEYIGQGFP